MAVVARRSGVRDFDFLHGSWRIANERLRARLTGSKEWERFEAAGTCTPILGGMGNIDAFRPLGPDREGLEAMALRLFDPAAGLWSIFWAYNVRGVPGPPVVGGFADGEGEFFGNDRHEGPPVLVRFRWSEITADAARWEQAFSTDGGATWETNWIMRFARAPAAS